MFTVHSSDVISSSGPYATGDFVAALIEFLGQFIALDHDN